MRRFKGHPLCVLCLSLAACSSSGSDASGGTETAAPASVQQAVPSTAATSGTAGSADVAAPRGGAGAGPGPAAGSGGSATAAPAATAAAGSGGEPSAPASAAAGASAGAAGSEPSSAGAAAALPASGLPAISDAGAKGPFEIEVLESLEGLDTHILIAPKELGKDGIKHPIVVWINGAGTGSTGYRQMLDNVAAHGFFLLDDKQSTFEVEPEVEAQAAAITWAIEQAEKQGGPYFGKLDTTRIAIAGHSLGSVSTWGNVGDKRIKTSIHMAGGVVGNPQGVDEGWIDNLHVPAAFFCGELDSNGLQRCKNDYASAPTDVPVFFGLLAGVGHTDEFTETNGGRWGRILVSWLRWQLADDASFAKAFEGPSCEFCMGDWTAMKHAID